jgi:phage FluMu protein Com
MAYTKAQTNAIQALKQRPLCPQCGTQNEIIKKEGRGETTYRLRCKRLGGVLARVGSVLLPVDEGWQLHTDADVTNGLHRC